MLRSGVCCCVLLLTSLVSCVDSKHMNAFIEDILTRIQDLLELAPPVSVSVSSFTNSLCVHPCYFYHNRVRQLC